MKRFRNLHEYEVDADSLAEAKKEAEEVLFMSEGMKALEKDKRNLQGPEGNEEKWVPITIMAPIQLAKKFQDMREEEKLNALEVPRTEVAFHRAEWAEIKSLQKWELIRRTEILPSDPPLSHKYFLRSTVVPPVAQETEIEETYIEGGHERNDQGSVISVEDDISLGLQGDGWEVQRQDSKEGQKIIITNKRNKGVEGNSTLIKYHKYTSNN